MPVRLATTPQDPVKPPSASPTMVLTLGMLAWVRDVAAGGDASVCRTKGVGFFQRALSWPPPPPSPIQTQGGRLYDLAPAIDEARDALKTFCGACRLGCDLAGRRR